MTVMGFCEKQIKQTPEVAKWPKRNKMDSLVSDFESDKCRKTNVDNIPSAVPCKLCNTSDASTAVMSPQDGLATLSCERKGLCHNHHTVSKRSRACLEEQERNCDDQNNDGGINLEKYQSDHVTITRFLNRPSREILAAEYPHLLFPGSHVCNYSRLAATDLSTDLEARNLDIAYELLYSAGWYYGPLTVFEARLKLKPYDNGTFLLRDSSDPKHLFSLSVKTQRGTTSIRIRFDKGQFSLEAEPGSECGTVSFNCVMKLIQNYVAKTSHEENYVLLETSGRMDTPFSITRGCTQTPGKLKHLCRKSLNNYLSPEQRQRLLLFMPPAIETYMTEYPFIV